MAPIPPLDENAKKVFNEIREHVAMPLLEIAATTGIGGTDLDESVKALVHERLITVKRADDPLETIISVSGRYY